METLSLRSRRPGRHGCTRGNTSQTQVVCTSGVESAMDEREARWPCKPSWLFIIIALFMLLVLTAFALSFLLKSLDTPAQRDNPSAMLGIAQWPLNHAGLFEAAFSDHTCQGATSSHRAFSGRPAASQLYEPKPSRRRPAEATATMSGCVSVQGLLHNLKCPSQK